MAVIRQRKTNKGEKRYQAYIRIKGFKPIMKTFDKFSKAQDWAQKVEVQMKDGTYKEAEIENIKFDTIRELIEYFKNEVAPKRYSYAEKYNVMYDWWIDKIGDIKTKKISAAILTQCVNMLANEKIIKKQKEVVRSNNTINKYIMAMSAILTYAFKQLEIIEYNPMSKVKIMKKPQGRTEFMSKEEVQLFADACKKDSEIVYIYFILLVTTGGRSSEVQTLDVENFDFKNNRVHFVDTKNGTNRGVGIGQSTAEYILKFLQKNNIKSGPIFINRKTGKYLYLKGKLEKIKKEIGLEKYHIHDLRHTFASMCAKEGANLLDISILLGHKSLVMARRYTHLTQQHTDDIARKTSSYLDII